MYIISALDVMFMESSKYKESIEQYIKIWNPIIAFYDKDVSIGIYGNIIDDVLLYIGLNPVDILYEISCK